MNGSVSDRRVALVTGSSCGIGAAAARLLAQRGDRVVVVADHQTFRSVAAELGADGHVADFADMGHVRELADELERRYQRIDVLINNAGLIAAGRRTVTADGHELTFQVNHLASFLLTVLIRGPLSAARARVITTSSPAGAARDASVNLADLDMTEGYDSLRAYKSSKLAHVLFTPGNSPGGGGPWG